MPDNHSLFPEKKRGRKLTVEGDLVIAAAASPILLLRPKGKQSGQLPKEEERCK